MRNLALRRLGEVQEGELHVIIPIEPVLEALWFLLGSDRNKAAWAFVRIVETEGVIRRQQILDKAGEVLVEMAGMRNTIYSEPARKVLALLAGREFGEDGAAWRRWFEQTNGPGKQP